MLDKCALECEIKAIKHLQTQITGLGVSRGVGKEVRIAEIAANFCSGLSTGRSRNFVRHHCKKSERRVSGLSHIHPWDAEHIAPDLRHIS